MTELILGRKQHLLKCLAYFIVGVPQQVTIEELPKVRKWLRYHVLMVMGFYWFLGSPVVAGIFVQ